MPMNELTKDKALLVVMAVGIFASGYYFHEYNIFSAHQIPVQSAYSNDNTGAIDHDLSASAASSLDDLYLGDDAFTDIEDISTDTPVTE